MKNQVFISALVVLLFVGSSTLVLAKTDVAGKVTQLKENSENSKANLKQYEDNMSTVDSNLLEAQRALKAIEKEKQSLTKQTSDTAKGKLSVGAAKKQIQSFMQTEQIKLDAERKQIEELKKTLVQLESNQKKREENLTAYKLKEDKVGSELASWSERNQSIIELEQSMNEKEGEARADVKRLTEKKVTYETEVSKWRKQTRLAERSYENFSKLKD